MKAIWKGAIGFGLVNIPVKLYSATEQSNLDLDMVDKRDMGKIHFKRVNESTGKEVVWENIGKAYTLEDTQILLDDHDFAEAAPEKSKIIEVNHFVDEKEIDSIYYESSYYVEPEKTGLKAYALLREALVQSGKVGVAQFVMRTAAALTVLKPKDNILVLSKIRFAQEIRNTDEIILPAKGDVKPAELKMALALIEQYTDAFHIDQFKDEYAEALLEVIKRKAKGTKPEARNVKMPADSTRNLMDQLKASLEKKKAS